MRDLERHREYNRKYMRWYRTAHRDEIREYKRQYRRKKGIKPRLRLNPDEKRIRERLATNKWRTSHRDAWARINAAHTHRRRGAIGKWTAEQLAQKFAYYGNKCFYCGSKDRPLTVDHFIPFRNRGTNWLANVRPSCKPCNQKKASHDPRLLKGVETNR